jgi:hypothetical protein
VQSWTFKQAKWWSRYGRKCFVLGSRGQLEQDVHKVLFSNMRMVLLQLRELASFSDDPFPAVTRILFTEADLQARA